MKVNETLRTDDFIKLAKAVYELNGKIIKMNLTKSIKMHVAHRVLYLKS